MHWSIDGWRIDKLARTATRGDRGAQLSPRAIRLLEVLIDAGTATVSRADLLERVWPSVFVSDESLTQVVAEVRRKLENRDIIATVPRGGYRLTVPAVDSDEARPDPFAPTRPAFSIDAYALCIEAVECFSSYIEGAERTSVDLAAQAVAAAPHSADARAHHALFLFKRHLLWSEGANLLETAFEEVETALELDPNNALAHFVGAWLSLFGGMPRFGWENLGTALALAPQNAALHLDAGALLLSQKCGRAAVALAVRSARLDRNQFEGDILAARLLMRSDPVSARVYAERALKKVRDELSINPHSMPALYSLGPLLAQLGDANAARSALEGVAHHNTPLEYYRAMGFAQIGDVSSALERLDFLTMRGWRFGSLPDNDEAFRPLYGDRRFRTLQAEIAAA